MRAVAACCLVMFVFAVQDVLASSVTIGIGDKPSSKNYGGKKGGPPPHAPAHGYRAKYRYHYYPSSEIYFDSGRGLYFYYSDKKWHASATLPLNLGSNLGGYVTIDMDSDKPYSEHAAHKSKYPPGGGAKNGTKAGNGNTPKKKKEK